MIPVTANTEAALAAAISAANALAFQTSASSPVVIEFAPALIGQTIVLTQALPALVVDHATLHVANAAPASRVVLDATNAPVAFRISSRHATIRNVRFQNAGAPGSQVDVFKALGTDDLTLANCDFDAATGNAIWLIGTRTTTVQDCNVRWSSGGLVVTGGATDTSVLHCTFAANQRAVVAAVGNDLRIRDSTFDGNGGAVTLQPICSDVTFGPGNVVTNTNTAACVVAFGAVRLNVTGNQFTDNQRAAIELFDLCADVTIADNTLARNGASAGEFQVRIVDCVDVDIRGLQCTAGGAGIFAGTTRLLTITGGATSPTSIGANNREAVTLNGCTDVAIVQVSVSDNLKAVGGAQVALLGCARVDIIGSAIDAALGPSRLGLRIDGCDDVRCGLGTSVLDNGAMGVLVNGSTDVVLGNWGTAAGSLSVRGPAPLQIIDCARVRVAGTASAPCTILAGTMPTGIAVSVTGSNADVFGPDLVVDGQQTTSIAMQIAMCNGELLDGVTCRGHTAFGIKGASTPSLTVRNCAVDGALSGAQTASGDGVLLNPGCHGAQLFGNLVQRQQGAAFRAVDSDDVLLGPGNRAIDNPGDGFVVTDSGSGPATRRATIQSAVAVGRGLATQYGFRCIHARAILTNVTATRNGTGVLLQNGAVATLVNTISWGNLLDRNRDPASSGTWLNGMRATSAGTGSPGAWSEQNMLVGVDPRFVAAAAGDVRLMAGSPAIDSGLHNTPVGAGLPAVDAALLPRIRGGVIDRGATEFTSGTIANSLDLAGPWLRPASQGQLAFTVQRGSQAGNTFLLLVSGSGTGPGFAAPPIGISAPLVPDMFTTLLLSAPALSVGVLNGAGLGTVSLPLPPEVVPFLPELSFAAVFSSPGPSTNPVVVRFLP